MITMTSLVKYKISNIFETIIKKKRCTDYAHLNASQYVVGRCC